MTTAITSFAYLYPTDRPERERYRNAIEMAARSVRNWYKSQLYGQTTFSVTDPIVDVIALDHPAVHYRRARGGEDFEFDFWHNVFDEAREKTGAFVGDRSRAWIFYVDADPASGQRGGAGLPSIAILPANDLRGLCCENIQEADGRPTPNLPYGVERWIGGLGHEIGHAFGLAHPPGCDDGSQTCDEGALMWAGFYDGYPKATYLREDEKAFLLATPFFSSCT